MSWPPWWPEEVRAHYEQLSRQRAWLASTIEAFSASVEYFRTLSQSTAVRRYFQCEAEGDTWAFEAVPIGADLIVIRQVRADPAGRLYRYSWDHLEDSDGGLTDGYFTPIDEHYAEVTHLEFDQVWGQAAPTG